MIVKPLVSIIVPIYNIEDYLPECVLSIMHQTYENIQIVLVDDGSTDKSGEICEDFARKDTRIKVVHQMNGGLVCARKAGLEVSDGAFIGFVDGDDYINSNMYKELLDNLILTKADFVHSGFEKVFFNVSQLGDGVIDISKNKAEFINHYILSSRSEQHMNFSIWSKLFKADFIKNCYSEVPNTQVWGEDLLNLITCILCGRKVSLLNSVYYNYRVRNTSITHTKSETALEDVVRLFGAVEKILKKYHCYEAVKEVLIKDWLRAGVCDALERINNDPLKVERFQICDIKMLFDKKVVIYGAGRVGRDYYAQICRYSRCKIIAWVDADHEHIHYDCTEVLGKESLKHMKYDYLIIAVQRERNALEIRNVLINEDKVEAGKIVWIEPNCGRSDGVF